VALLLVRRRRQQQQLTMSTDAGAADVAPGGDYLKKEQKL
jgi:hypothetical protein